MILSRFSIAFLMAASATAHSQTPFLHAPAIDEYARHDPRGTTILPNGRFLRPAGRHIPVARWPHGLTLSPDGRTLFVASEGVGQLVSDWTSDSPTVETVSPISPSEGSRGKRANGGASAFSPDRATLYWSSGDRGGVFVVDVPSRKVASVISLNVRVGGRKFEDSFVMDLKLSADGRHLYCADLTNFRVAVIDTQQKKVISSIRVGRYPYALAVAGRRAYVANVGMFEYTAVPPPENRKGEGKRGRGGAPAVQHSNHRGGTSSLARASGDHSPHPNYPITQQPDPRGLTYPPYGFPSKEARDGVFVEGRAIPGLGDPNVPESFSVWGVDFSDPLKPRVVSKTKTGLLVGAPSEDGKTIGGSAPNFVAIHRNALYVSNGNNDMIERIDIPSGRIVWRKRITPSQLTKKLRGVGPAGMVLTPDGKRIYVAESGINAIGVFDTATGSVLGHIPTAWYPFRLALSSDGMRLACICFKGFANGPNAGKQVPQSPFLGMKGVLSVITAPQAGELKRMTSTVLENNGMVDRRADVPAMSSPLIPITAGKTSEQIKYVVFITKENHTYDTIFDHIPGANDDPTLLRWGYHQRIENAGQPTLEDAAVITNHNALAKQFTISDNFYMEPEASGVGHRWLVGVQPNNFCQMTYTLGWDFKANSSAPGRLVSFGSNGSIAPEDYPEAGSMWEHLARSGIRFRNYGEGFEFAGVKEDENEKPTGAREVINMPMPKVLFDNTCREFPIFNMNIPDQYRAEQFMRDFSKLYLQPQRTTMDDGRWTIARSGERKSFIRLDSAVRAVALPGAKNNRPSSIVHRQMTPPSFINIAICNDHGTKPDPKKGYPYRASWMADNDLALGRIVEFLSHTPYWKNMAIFVTQDDAGGEPDHIDAQRSVLLVISPWVKRGYVSHRHTTILSMHRTLYEILGLPPLNMFDALANDFSDCFIDKPDFTPYSAEKVDARIFDPAKVKDPKDPDYRQARLRPSIRLDDPEEVEEMAREGAQRR